jgi:hypothetical protein
MSVFPPSLAGGDGRMGSFIYLHIHIGKYDATNKTYELDVCMLCQICILCASNQYYKILFEFYAVSLRAGELARK